MATTIFLKHALFSGSTEGNDRLNVKEEPAEIAKSSAEGKLIELTRKDDKGTVWIAVDEILGMRETSD